MQFSWKFIFEYSKCVICIPKIVANTCCDSESEEVESTLTFCTEEVISRSHSRTTVSTQENDKFWRISNDKVYIDRYLLDMNFFKKYPHLVRSTLYMAYVRWLHASPNQQHYLLLIRSLLFPKYHFHFLSFSFLFF